MKKLTFVLFIMLFIPLSANAANVANADNTADGIINVKSQFDAKTTADRLEKILNEKGMTIFNIIKHSESAAKIGIPLRDTELIIFGNPKVGSLLMKCQQSIAIDLPQKALIWKDNNNQVWISYNDIEYLKNRHNVQGCEKVILKVGAILDKIIKSASSN